MENRFYCSLCGNHLTVYANQVCQIGGGMLLPHKKICPVLKEINERIDKIENKLKMEKE